MPKDRVILTAEELKQFLPDASQALLLEIANNISGYLNSVKDRIESRNKKKENYKHLNDAKNHLKKAVEALQQGKEGLSPEIYTLFVDEGLEPLVNSISACIPKEKPKSIEKQELEHLFELLHLGCEKANPSIGWYTRDDAHGGHKGDFFLLCKLASEKLRLFRSESAIHKYLSNTSKPNREKMKQVYKTLGDDVTLAKIWAELDKLS